MQVCHRPTSRSELPEAKPPEDPGRCGLGGDLRSGEAIVDFLCVCTQVRQWENNKTSMHIYVCLWVCVVVYKLNSNQDQIFSSYIKFSLCSLCSQADILITTSLLNWKCEPRKQHSARKACPLSSLQYSRFGGCDTFDCHCFTRDISSVRS